MARVKLNIYHCVHIYVFRALCWALIALSVS
jgi:hypothetical protein